MGQVTRTLVRTGLSSDEEGRAVSMSFLDNGDVLVLCDDGDHRVLSQLGMTDCWEVLWQDVAKGLECGGWERV